MLISLNIILEELGLPQQGSASGSLRFSRAVLAEGRLQDLSDEYIYIASEKTALKMSAGQPGLIFLCPGGKDGRQEGNVIYVQGEDSVPKLLERVQDIFFRLNSWVAEMRESLIEERSIQKLIDISEYILGNTINVTDSALTLVACTRNIETDDPVSTALRDNGYHNSEAVEFFEENNCLKQWSEQEGILSFEDHRISNYDMLDKVFSFRSTYYNHAVMVCDHRPLTNALRDLFEVFIDHLSICVEETWRRQEEQIEQTFVPLLQTLVEHSWTDTQSLKKAAARAELQFTGTYQLLLIRTEKEAAFNSIRILRELKELLSGCNVAVYNGYVTALLKGQNVPLSGQKQARIRWIIEKYEASTGVSEVYSSLDATDIAYRQAMLAVRFGKKMNRASNGTDKNDTDFADPENNVSFFGDHSICYLLADAAAGSGLWEDEEYLNAIERLRTADEDRGGNWFRLLETYLSCERNSTLTGKLMHTHRNNIAYHIGKIEEFLDIDLDDPEVRLSIMIAYVVLRMKERR